MVLHIYRPHFLEHRDQEQRQDENDEHRHEGICHPRGLRKTIIPGRPPVWVPRQRVSLHAPVLLERDGQILQEVGVVDGDDAGGGDDAEPLHQGDGQAHGDGLLNLGG